jgi:hypothetical protein
MVSIAPASLHDTVKFRRRTPDRSSYRVDIASHADGHAKAGERLPPFVDR